jgi:hypothetical protein
LSPSVCFDFDRSNLAKKKSLPKKSDFIRSARFFLQGKMNANWCIGPTQKLLFCAWFKYWRAVGFLPRSLDMNHEVLSLYVLAIVVSHTTIKREIQLFYGADFVSGGFFENGET